MNEYLLNNKWKKVELEHKWKEGTLNHWKIMITNDECEEEGQFC